MAKSIKVDQITAMQYKILEYLYVSQPVTPSNISECLHISMPNTSRELKKLQEGKLIERVADIEDRRKQYIRLSDNGQLLMNTSFSAIEQQFLERIEHISSADLEEVQRALMLLQTKVFY